MIQTYSELARTSGQAVQFLTQRKTGCRLQFNGLAETLASRGVQPVIPRVVAKEIGVTPGPEQAPEAGEKSPAGKQLEVSGVGVFKEDRLIGWLDAHQTRGLLWLKGEPMQGVVVIPSPGEPDKEVSVIIRRGKTRVTPEYDGGTARFEVRIHMEGDVAEQQSKEDLARPEMIKVLEGEVAAEIKQRAADTLEKAQSEYGVDIFGFGDAFHRKNKQAWRQLKYRWDEEFALAEVNITVEAHIREIGLAGKRPSAPEE